MAGVKDGSRRNNMRSIGDMEAGEVNRDGQILGEHRNLCRKRCFWYARVETGDDQVGG